MRARIWRIDEVCDQFAIVRLNYRTCNRPHVFKPIFVPLLDQAHYLTKRQSWSICNIDIKQETMQERTFNLSVPLSRLFVVGCILGGVIEIAGSFFSIRSGDSIFGVAQLVFGLFLLLFVSLTPRIHRYIITFDDSYLTLDKSLFKPRKIPWASISEVEIQLMKLEIALKEGKNVKWNFNMSYTDNQFVKPQIISALTEFAGAKGIPIRDSRS